MTSSLGRGSSRRANLQRGWLAGAALDGDRAGSDPLDPDTDDDMQGAIDELQKVIGRVDGNSSPPDWLEDGQEKDKLRPAVELLIALLEVEL